MAQSISVDEQTRHLVESERQPTDPRADPYGPRSGNAIVGVAVSALLWLMLASLLVLLFWH